MEKVFHVFQTLNERRLFGSLNLVNYTLNVIGKSRATFFKPSAVHCGVEYRYPIIVYYSQKRQCPEGC